MIQAGARASVIVPAFNAAKILREGLVALQNQTCPPLEIIVVDDGSTDATGEVAQACGARVLHQAHRGPAAARNLGAEQACGEVLLFTDADCVPAPDWVAQMLAPLVDANVVATKGTYRSRQRSLVARLVQLEYAMRYERMAQFDSIDFVDTYSAAFRRDTFLRVGGFDAVFPIPSAEDVDLSFRLARQGCRMVFAPDAWVWHTHPTSLRVYLTRKAQYGWWRALLYLRFPEKIRGDAHTAPQLKIQFALFALLGLTWVGAFIWQPLVLVAFGAFLGLVATTLPFARWAWRRDATVALLSIPIMLLRVVVQGFALALGLVRYGIFAR